MKDLKDQFIWNKCKVIPNKTYDENDYIRELLDASYQGVKRFFVLAYDIIFTGKASANLIIYYIFEQSKETILQFSKETTNVL